MKSFFRAICLREYLVGISASLWVMVVSHCYGWFDPTISYLLDPKNPDRLTESQVSWLVAIVSLGEVIGSIPAGLIADKWGRKIIIILTGPLFFISWVVISFFRSFTLFIFVRIVQGLGVAIIFSVLPVYLGEIASSKNRGRITGLISIAWYTGLLLEYCIGALLSIIPFTLVTAFVPLILTIIFYFQPESPYYLVLQGEETKAEAALECLRGNGLQDKIKIELENINKSVKEEFENKCSWKDIVQTPADRRALFVVLLIRLSRIQSGQIPLMTYTSYLFLVTGFSVRSANFLTIVVSVAMLLGGFISLSIVDALGRRPLIIISCLGSFFCLFTLSMYFILEEHLNVDVSLYRWIVVLALSLDGLFIVVGLYPISLTYTSELFTNKTRGKSASIVTTIVTIASFVSIKLFQIIGDNFGLGTVFLYFLSMCVLGGILLYIYAPETKGKTFIEIRAELLNIRNRNQILTDKQDTYILKDI